MIDEKLSSLMDGELTEKEVDELLERLGNDAELRAAWSRQHLASTTLQENVSPAYVDPGFADRVMSALDAEPRQAQSGRKILPFPSSRGAQWTRRRRWYRSVAGLAVAASVAAVAVLVVEQPSTNVHTQVASEVATARAPSVQPAVGPRTVDETSAPASQQNGDMSMGNGWDSSAAAGFDSLFRTVSSSRWARDFEEAALTFPTDTNTAVSNMQSNLDVTQPAKRRALEGVWLNHNSYPNDTGLSSMMGYMHLTAQESASTPPAGP